MNNRQVRGREIKRDYMDELISSEKWHLQKVISVWLNIRKMAELFLNLCLSPPLEFTIIIFTSLLTDSKQRLEVDTRTDTSHLYVEFKSTTLTKFLAFSF